MNSMPASEYPQQLLMPHLKRIPFFKTILEESPDQFELMMSYAKVMMPEAGEIIIEKGERDPWLYFVLKGQLIIYPENEFSPSKAVNSILPGEIVGALALIKNEPRGATVAFDASSKSGLLLGIHFSAFGDLTNFRLLNMKTKLELLKMVTDHTRWKIEQYRSKFPNNPLGKRLNSLDVFKGPKNSVNELRALYNEAQQLGQMLTEWNIAHQFTRRYREIQPPRLGSG